MNPLALPDKLLSKMSAKDRKSLGKAGLTRAEVDAKATAKCERDIQDKIRQFLDLRGWFYAWQRMDKRASGKLGQPDFVICLPFRRGVADHGLFCAIECKMPGNSPTPQQQTALQAIHRDGGEILVTSSAQSAIDWLIQLSTL